MAEITKRTQFLNDNAVAVFLLERNKALTELLSQRAKENR